MLVSLKGRLDINMEYINRMEFIHLIITPCLHTNIELFVRKPCIMLCMQRKHDCIKLHTMDPTTGLDTNISIYPHTCHTHHPLFSILLTFFYLFKSTDNEADYVTSSSLLKPHSVLDTNIFINTKSWSLLLRSNNTNSHKKKVLVLVHSTHKQITMNIYISFIENTRCFLNPPTLH
jgi:hypothetical protein